MAQDNLFLVTPTAAFYHFRGFIVSCALNLVLVNFIDDFKRISAVKDDPIYLAGLKKLECLLDYRYFCKSQAVKHAHTETLVLTRYYTAAQLVLFNIFLVQHQSIYQMEY